MQGKHYSTMYVRVNNQTSSYQIHSKQAIHDIVVEIWSNRLGKYQGTEYIEPQGHGAGDMLVDVFENGKVTVMHYSKLA